MTDSLITGLARVPGLLVIARHSAFQYKNTHGRRPGCREGPRSALCAGGQRPARGRFGARQRSARGFRHRLPPLGGQVRPSDEGHLRRPGRHLPPHHRLAEARPLSEARRHPGAADEESRGLRRLSARRAPAPTDGPEGARQRDSAFRAGGGSRSGFRHRTRRARARLHQQVLQPRPRPEVEGESRSRDRTRSRARPEPRRCLRGSRGPGVDARKRLSARRSSARLPQGTGDQPEPGRGHGAPWEGSICTSVSSTRLTKSGRRPCGRIRTTCGSSIARRGCTCSMANPSARWRSSASTPRLENTQDVVLALLWLGRDAEAARGHGEAPEGSARDGGPRHPRRPARAEGRRARGRGGDRLRRSGWERGWATFITPSTTSPARTRSMGRNEESLRWLRRTAADGFPCYPLFEKDPLLDPGCVRTATSRRSSSEMRKGWEIK